MTTMTSPLKSNPIKCNDEDYHNNFKNLSVHYNQVKLAKAQMIKSVCGKLFKMEDEYDRDLSKFKQRIKKGEKLNLQQIKELDSVHKCEYVKQIFEDHEAVEFYVDTVQDKLDT